MIFRRPNSQFPYYIDAYKMKDYAETERLYCINCGRNIKIDEEYFAVLDDIFCFNCSENAYESIIEAIRDEFIYVN